MARYSASRIVNTMVREMERESKRQARVRQQEITRMEREARRQEKENQKQTALRAAKLEVERFENEIELLLTLHKESPDPVDWDAELRALPSAFPLRIPVDRLKSERLRLFDNPSLKWESVVSARELASGGHQNIPVRSSNRRQLAADVCKGGEASYSEAIIQYSALDEVDASGCELDLIYHDMGRYEVVLELGGVDFVPSEMKSLRANGKVSVKKMPIKKRAEIYQDYICSCILRVAREVFAVLPVREVLLNAKVPLGASEGGCRSLSTVYSVVMKRCDLEGLDFETLDPSDTIESFPHRGDFKASRKVGSFLEVEPLVFDKSTPASARASVSELCQRVTELREHFSERNQTA